MAVPLFSDLQDPGLEMLRIARERLGAGYDNNTYSVTSPISLKDLSNLSGGNSGGSGNSYPAINTLNVQSPAFSRNRRPDGQDPLKMSEFFGYNQNLQRRVVRFAYSNVNKSTACSFTIQLFDPSSGVSEDTVAEVIGGGGGFAGTVVGIDSC